MSATGTDSDERQRVQDEPVAMVIGVPLQVGAHDGFGFGARQISRRVQPRGVDAPQVPQQALFGDAFGDPTHGALLHAAQEGLRFLDRLLMARALGLLQLFVELRAHPREKALTSPGSSVSSCSAAS